MAKLITPEILEQIITLAGQGMSQRNIAIKLGITRDQVQHNLAKSTKSTIPQNPPKSQVSEPTMIRGEKYEPETRVRILTQINDDLELRYKKMKREFEELETDFKKARTERDDLKLELKLFNAEKDLEIKQITAGQKGGLNGLVDKLGDPNVLANLPNIVQAFQMVMGKNAQVTGQATGANIPLPIGISDERSTVLKFLVDTLTKVDDNKFTQISTLVATTASTNEFDGWLNESYIAMITPQPQNPNPTNPK